MVAADAENRNLFGLQAAQKFIQHHGGFAGWHGFIINIAGDQHRIHPLFSRQTAALPQNFSLVFQHGIFTNAFADMKIGQMQKFQRLSPPFASRSVLYQFTKLPAKRKGRLCFPAAIFSIFFHFDIVYKKFVAAMRLFCRNYDIITMLKDGFYRRRSHKMQWNSFVLLTCLWRLPYFTRHNKGVLLDMNILFFLTPKSKVAYIYDDYTLRQTLEKMEHHRYSAVPILTRSGAYLGTITEGDLLWAIKNKYSLNFKEAESLSIMEVSRRMDNEPVSAETEIEDLLSKAMNQNFVPVTDDRGIFIGIITRKDIMRYFSQKLYVEAPKPLPLSDYQMRSASR